MLPLEIWSKVANNLPTQDCLNLFIILINTDELSVEQVKLLKKWYDLFMMPPTLKAMLNVYRKIDIINSKKLYMKYFNNVSSSMFKIKLKISSSEDVCEKRLILSKKIKDERKRKKFLNLTKKLVPFYADLS